MAILVIASVGERYSIAPKILFEAGHFMIFNYCQAFYFKCLFSNHLKIGIKKYTWLYFFIIQA